MTTFFLLCFMAQEIKYIPISPGNVVPIDSFQVTVPDGVLLAEEDNVASLYPLIGVEGIPNCAGIFVDDSNDWDYQMIIQHWAFQRFSMEDVDPSVFTTIFSQTHFLTTQPYVGDVDFFMPPVVNELDRTFSFGVHYFNTELRAGFFAKKVWLSDQGGLIITLNATEEAYERNAEKIAAIFQSVSLNPNEEKVELKTAPLDFLALLGVSKQEPPPVEAVAAPGEGLSTSVILTSLGLAVLAGLLLFFAMKLQKQGT